MQLCFKKRVLYLAVIFTAFSFSQAEAQIWGSLKNAVKKKAEEVVTKEIGDKSTKKSKQEKAKTASNQDKSQKQTPASTGKISSPDIVGLKLGMTPDQVVNFLKKRNKDYEIEKIESDNKLFNPAYVMSISASLPDGKERFVIDFSDPVSKNLSVTIRRYVNYQEGRYPLTKKIIAGLTKKYGMPSISQGDEGLAWLIDQNDNVIHVISGNMESSCSTIVSRSYRKMFLDRSICGLFILAGLNNSNGVSRSFTIRLADERLIVSNNTRTQKYIADQKAAEAQKRKEKASKVKVDTDF